MSSKNVIEIVKNLHNRIEDSMRKEERAEVKNALDELSKIAKTETYYIVSTTLFFESGDIEEAALKVKEGLQQFSYSYSLHFNAALIHFTLQKFDNSFYHFGRCLRLSENKEEIEAVRNNLNEMVYTLKKQQIYSSEQLQKCLNKVDQLSKEIDERVYPLNKFGESIIRTVQNRGTENENMTNLYKSIFIENIDDLHRFFTKTEYFQGHEAKRYQFAFIKKTTLPFSFLEKDTELTIKINNTTYDFTNSLLKFNQYNYLTFDPGEIEITANKPIFIGNPIALNDEPKKYRLVAHVFIDGLSGKYLEENDRELLIPNISNTFNSKYENTNCYASADWTFPSNAGLVTAMDTIAHGQYHSTFGHDFSEKQESLIEKIRKSGYFTASFTGDWRGTPPHGYGKSFDRIVFKNSMGGFGAGEIMEEVIDHLETFKEKNNYIWLVLPDLHDVADEIFPSINSQVNTNVLNRLFSKKGDTSVLTDYDKNKIIRYGEELKRIDLHLSVLFNYIKHNYDEDDVLVIIHSDHGQGYFEKEPNHFLNYGRTKVPFMLLGGGMQGTSDKLMSNLDIYPTILDLLNIEYDKEKLHGKTLEDFGGTQRKEVMTESYHPNQTYKAVIYTRDFQFYFETEDSVDNYGRVDLEHFKTDLIKLNDNLNDTNVEEIIDYYTNWILEKRVILQK
ncbi:sulfatase-like hydrolase/transferase [Lysinibacillus xylanilyticus]|uniref:Sulfatase-like hydrolase/transferase n=1 Tax=Lysinibacillus xylanilyticus TaxID=582475 RepID=A0A2M9PZE1_9BACI|nr:sulfatase-like hydrolase/transferase [Lysinibacillus xylanilyticus]MCY9546114.1 sulfatase-like hydrolase/transferase [Lysinibacillus xylanilyticus]PJO41183.1 hypothetical protein CWD94_23890 [Lysinibacillus xylanilyticus]